MKTRGWYRQENYFASWHSCVATAVLIGIFSLISGASMAHLGVNEQKNNSKPKNNDDGQAKSAGCIPALQRFIMDFNDVSALLEMGGLFFRDRQNNVAAYEVPKGGGVTALYAASLWMGGTDVNGQLKLAAVRFRSNGNDFWGGPLTVNPLAAGPGVFDPVEPVGDNTIRPYGPAEVSPEVCAAYDRFFPVNKATVIKFRTWWTSCVDPNAPPESCAELDDQAIPTNAELASLREWPAHGDIALEQDYYLAPFYDMNKDGYYNVDDGDYPWYDDILGIDDVECGIDRRVTLFGDQTVWFVFNDKGNGHTESGGAPIGMEIRGQAFVFATADEINRMTFYNYELINRSTQELSETYFAQYVDPDLGNPIDDYVGCDVSRGLGYVYNGDAEDEDGTNGKGYGLNPPAVGFDFFEGPYQDPDGLDNPGPQRDPVTGTWIVPDLSDALAQNGIVYSGIGTG